MLFSDADLAELIACRKVIVGKPRRDFKDDGSHYRNDMNLVSEDNRHSFSVFMRWSKEFPENFSIGLVLLPRSEGDEKITLIRYNGIHGGHIEFPHHSEPHIHRITSTLLTEGILSEARAQVTDSYSTYQEALAAFCSQCKIVDADKYFPHITPPRETDIFQNLN